MKKQREESQQTQQELQGGVWGTEAVCCSSVREGEARGEGKVTGGLGS